MPPFKMSVADGEIKLKSNFGGNNKKQEPDFGWDDDDDDDEDETYENLPNPYDDDL